MYNGQLGEEEKLNWVRMHVGQSGVGDEESLSLDRIYDGKTGGRGDLNLVRMKYGKSGENELLNLMRMHDKVRDEHYMERGGAEPPSLAVKRLYEDHSRDYTYIQDSKLQASLPGQPIGIKKIM